MKSLFAVEVVSTSLAYKLLNEIAENSWLEIVEISSASNAKNILLFKTDNIEKLKILNQRIEEKYGQPSRRIFDIFSPQIYDMCLIEDAHPSILPTLISLEQNPISESLIIFEAESICASIQAMQIALKDYQLKICDLKIYRQSGGMNHVFMTGSQEKCELAAASLKQLLFSNYLIGQVEVIAQPEMRIRKFFEL